MIENAMAFENGVESLLGIWLNYVLLVLHQLDYVLKVLEIAEALTHGFRFGVESDQLPDDYC